MGGGLVGSLAALALIKKNKKTLVIEKSKTTYSDDRTLAVNANSREFLKNLGLWEKLKSKPEDIKKIKIKDNINFESLIFDSQEETMGSVIFNKDLLKIAHNELKIKNLIYKDINIPINNLLPHQVITINKKKFNFKKIIVCVGKNYLNSKVLKKFSFRSNHNSFVGFFNHTKQHNNVAYEHFTNQGPLAVLPAPKKEKKLSTFIFSTKEKMNIKKIEILIKKNFQQSHGEINLISKLSTFPINPHISKPNNINYLLIGDTLRSIHPVAGQGWNLGIKDIQDLLSIIDANSLEHKHFNHLYYAKRSFDNVSYLFFTSLLNNLYENQNIVSSNLIRFGFQSLLRFSSLKDLFIKQAMGRLF